MTAGGGTGSTVWGQITGTLSDQTDLQNALTSVANSATNAANAALSASNAANSAASVAANAYNAANSAANVAANAYNAANSAASLAQDAYNAANAASGGDVTAAGDNSFTGYNEFINESGISIMEAPIAEATTSVDISNGHIDLFKFYNNQFYGAAIDAVNGFTAQGVPVVPVSGTNDGTYWTSIAIDGVNKALPSGGSSVTIDNKTIIQGQNGIETAVGGYTSTSQADIVFDGNNNGFLYNTAPYWNYTGGINALKTYLNIPNQGNSTTCSKIEAYLNGSSTPILSFTNVTVSNNGSNGIYINKQTGDNRISVQTESSQTDNVRLKFYVTSSATEFNTETDVIDLYWEVSPGNVLTVPIDTKFIKVDNSSITVNASNELQTPAYAIAQNALNAANSIYNSMMTIDTDQSVSGTKTW